MALYFKETGSQNTTTLVLLHGGGAGGWSWDLQLPDLADFHCLVPDLPEHGRSLDAGPLSIEGAAEQVAELIGAHAHDGRAHIVGLSMGGQVGVQLLARAPESIHKALLSGTLVRPLPGAALLRHPFIEWLNLTSLRLYMPFRNWTFLIRANMSYYGFPRRFEPQFREETRRLTPEGMMRVIYQEGLNFRLPSGLEKAQVPTLVTVGQKEYAVMHQSARDLAAALPQARAYRVSGVGHNWSLTHPERFTETLRAWLTDRPLPTGLIPL